MANCTAFLLQQNSQMTREWAQIQEDPCFDPKQTPLCPTPEHNRWLKSRSLDLSVPDSLLALNSALKFRQYGHFISLIELFVDCWGFS